MNAVISLLTPPFYDLTYSLPAEFPDTFWEPGMRVAVPLGRGGKASPRAGIVRELTDETPEGVQLKDILWPLECRPLLPPVLRELLKDLAHRQCMREGEAVAQILPFLKDTAITLRRTEKPKPGGNDPFAGKRSLKLADIRKASPPEREHLVRALLEGRAQIVPPRTDGALYERCSLACDAPWPIRPGARVQRAVLEYLAFHGRTNRRKLMQETGASHDTLDALIRQKLVRVETGDDTSFREEELNDQLTAPSAEAVVPNADQKAAIAELMALLEQGDAATRLLYGVTGSGKTAVYLAIAQTCLNAGKSVLLLAPEVALAYKLRNDVRKALPDAPLVLYHGYQGASSRESTFRELACSQKAAIVVGTRSALFLPLRNPGIIVLDEEHDASFKQEDHIPYQAKEIAWFRARKENALLVLGTATPDVKTWYAAMQDRLPVLKLPRRIAERPLPPVELVDISQVPDIAQEQSLLAPATLEAIGETLGRGEQAVILLNRRGFAPLIYCPDCRKTLTCPNCSVGLSYHRNEGRLLCHYCGYSMPFPSPCPSCHAMNFIPVGEGTERLEDYLATRYSGHVLRLDRDITRRAGAMEEILSRFARHEADILVGTQMLSKGHHFPEVTLAVIVDADLGLNLPDYRSAERTFQLLVQASGRAGRGDKPGRVLIQTRDTSHYCWEFVRHADYEGFYRQEILRRKTLRYPPFTKLAMLRFSHERNDAAAGEAMQALGQKLRKQAREQRIMLLGPTPSPLSLLNGRRRYQCLVKADDYLGARQLYVFAASSPESAKIRIQLDLDPYSML